MPCPTVCRSGGDFVRAGERHGRAGNKCKEVSSWNIRTDILLSTVKTTAFLYYRRLISKIIEIMPCISTFFLAQVLGLCCASWQPVMATEPVFRSECSSHSTVSIVDSMPQYDVDYLMGKFDPSTRPDFAAIDEKYASRSGLYMRREAYEAFVRMHDAAMKDGVTLQILSAARNFDAQKTIWENKWTGQSTIEGGKNASSEYPEPVHRAKMLLKYSAMPGTSRHHWGTDIDLNALDNSYFRSGAGQKAYNWLTKHAAEYGYCQPYSVKGGKDRPHGYEEERWHWSYMPIATPLMQMAKDKLTDEMITGFPGSETAPSLHIVKYYVLMVNPACE